MRRPTAQPESREVDSAQTGRKRSPSDLARKERRAAGRALAAQQLAQRIEADSRRRQRDWLEGEPHDEFGVARRDDNLAALHQDKREMRREIFARAPELEGRPVLKGTPGGRD